MPETRLRAIRESIDATQEQVIRRTRDLSLRTYVRAENGQRITYSSAQQILEAMNSLLTDAKRPTVTIEDLGLNLY